MVLFRINNVCKQRLRLQRMFSLQTEHMNAVSNHDMKKQIYPLYVNIRIFREARGLSQKELALKAGYSDKSMICKIENGLVDLPFSKILVIARALDVPGQVLCGWDVQEAPLNASSAKKAAGISYLNQPLLAAAKQKASEDNPYGKRK